MTSQRYVTFQVCYLQWKQLNNETHLGPSLLSFVEFRLSFVGRFVLFKMSFIGNVLFNSCCDFLCVETTLSPLPPFPTSSSTVPSQSSSLLNPSLTVSRTANGLEYTNSIGMIPSSLTDASTRTRSRHLSSHIVTPTLVSVHPCL